MPLTKLTWDTLGHLQAGLAGAVIDAELQRAVDDLVDRGEEDGKARKVTIEIVLDPTKAGTVVTVQAQAKLPIRNAGATVGECRARPGGHDLLFRNSSNNINQPTFEDVGESEKE